MTSEQKPEPHPFCPPPGTTIGDWCLMGCQGHGAFGAVHRAVRVGQEQAGPVALKLALYPWDPRFMREVALLSLVHHPSVPSLLGHGFWKHPAGTVHPYVVMQWIEGTPLYEWAQEHHPTSGQVLQLLAQLARALQATHAASAVHRDVKGANVRIRHSDGRAMLMDFGAGHYQGVARLTWQSEPPGTPAYRSTEAELFWRAVRAPDSHYVAGPTDDIFSLGVTAYRLVTGEYPPSAEPRMDKAGRWHMEPPRLRPPSELNPRVSPQLSALILRMLSPSPQARGTAGELADALEAAAASNAEPLMGVRAPPSRLRPWGIAAAGVSACALILMGALLLPWSRQAVDGGSEDAPTKVRAASEEEAPDAGTAAVGDEASSAPLASAPQDQKAIAQESPPRPLPGQTRPDEKGQCPGREQLPINGGCWLELRTTDAASCEQGGYAFFKGKCFAPAFPSRRKPPPMSAPGDHR